MRHPLNLIVRWLPEPDRTAILGDLAEEYRLRVRPGRSWAGAQGWYAGQLLAAAAAYSWSGVASGAHPVGRGRPFEADLRYALRRWRRRPDFAVTAVLTLALGIGAATAMFSVVYGVLLRPLPWPEPERLAAIHMVYPERRADPRFASTWDRSPVHYPAWEALRHGSSFAGVAVWQTPSLSMTIDRARTELVEVMDVSSNFLPMLGVQVIHGRHFTPDSDERESYDLILSYEAWQRWFGGRADVIGQASPIAYASDTHTPPWVIVGVLAPGFSFEGYRPAVLRTIGMNAQPFRMFFRGDFHALARLAPGVSVEAASGEAAGLMQASQPGITLGGRVVPFADEQTGPAKRPLWLLFGAAGVLLLVACANVAGLILGENRTRRHETAVQLALGISRGGIVRQLVIEHALLAFAGATAGLVLATWLTNTLVALAPADLPRIDAVQIDWRIALFALAAGGVTLLGFGIVPALGLARTHAAEMLADGGREAAPARHLAQRTVVAVQIALAVVLISGASLLGETLFRLLSQPLGFDPSNVVVVSTTFTGSDIPRDWIRGTRGQNLNSGPPLSLRVRAIREARTKAVVERLSSLPGVVSAAAGAPPFAAAVSNTADYRIHLEGRPAEEELLTALHTVSPAFTETLRIPVVTGRGLGPSDGATAALVSREFERRYFPEGAVGRRFDAVGPLGLARPANPIAYEVVGVVADVKYNRFSDDPLPRIYTLGATTRFVIRTAAAADTVVPGIRAALAEVDPKIVVTSAATMGASLRGVIAAERFRAMLSSAFAGTALLLAAVGLYGVAARRVADRRREFGIRVALGAAPENLRALVLRDGGITVGLGLAVGLPAALAAARVTRAFLFGVSPAAAHIMAGTALVLAAAALAATFVPARRASRVDPIGALRQ